MFKLRSDYTKKEKYVISLQIQAILNSLKNKIPEIISYETGINILETPNSYDIVLVSTFENKESLQGYATNSLHLEALEKINKVCSDKKTVDYLI